MAASQRELNLRLVPLPIEVAEEMLAGKPRPRRIHARDARAASEAVRHWHPEYPLPDSVDAIALVFAAHRAMLSAINEQPPAWWIHQILVDGVVVGDIGFHGPPGPDHAVEIGYSVVPAWRRRGVASRACGLILRQAWQDGAEVVVAETDRDNVASQAVLLGNGFHQRSDGIFMIKRPAAR